MKRAAVAWGSGGGKPTPAKGPSLLARQVDKKPPILKMEVNVGGCARFCLVVISDPRCQRDMKSVLSAFRRGKTGLIVVRDGDSPAALAASFARVWQLDASTEVRLTRKRKLQKDSAKLGVMPV